MFSSIILRFFCWIQFQIEVRGREYLIFEYFSDPLFLLVAFWFSGLFLILIRNCILLLAFYTGSNAVLLCRIGSFVYDSDRTHRLHRTASSNRTRYQWRPSSLSFRWFLFIVESCSCKLEFATEQIYFAEVVKFHILPIFCHTQEINASKGSRTIVHCIVYSEFRYSFIYTVY